MNEPKRVRVGEPVLVWVSPSEAVADHGIGGQRQWVRLYRWGFPPYTITAQVLRGPDDWGEHFLPGEVGIYSDSEGFYYYPPDVV